VTAGGAGCASGAGCNEVGESGGGSLADGASWGSRDCAALEAVGWGGALARGCAGVRRAPAMKAMAPIRIQIASVPRLR
jgi:hypothetical protein